MQQKLLHTTKFVVYLQPKVKRNNNLKKIKDMTNKELLKSAQEEAGYVPTGYKGDVDLDVFILVCEKCWTRAINLSYDVYEWRKEVLEIVGQKNYLYFNTDANDFERRKIADGRTVVELGRRFCA